MISLAGVTKSYGTTLAVDNVDLNVQAGEIFGLVGPDGAGKTSIIRMIIGVLTPSAGDITVLGSRDIESVKANIGYVPQRFSLYGDLTVIENIRLIGSMYGAPAVAIERLATEILDFTKLLPFKDRLADNLSGGMKQKLALAAGLMHKPRIFFLDEPTTGVDPVSRREFWQMLYRLNKEGMTIFVSTPYMDEAELCTRIAFMQNGRIVACDSPQALADNYPHQLLELKVADKDVRRLLTGCGIRDVGAFGDKYHLVVDDATAAQAAVTAALTAAGRDIISLRPIRPTLEDVFVALAGEVAS